MDERRVRRGSCSGGHGMAVGTLISGNIASPSLSEAEETQTPAKPRPNAPQKEEENEETGQN